MDKTIEEQVNVFEPNNDHIEVNATPNRINPMNLNISNADIKKFNWKIYKYTIKQLNINAEYKALRHYQKYCKPGTKNYIKYFRNLYSIPPEFDEVSYCKYANITNRLTHEQLYAYFRERGHKEYPLCETYYKIYYKTENSDLFDTNVYYERYQDEIDNYDDYDGYDDEESVDWETGSQMTSMSSITAFSRASNMSTASNVTTRSMLSTFVDHANNHRHGKILSRDERIIQQNTDDYNNWKENLYNWYKPVYVENKKIYKFYKENGETYKLDNKYFYLKYKITNPLFDPLTYSKYKNINFSNTLFDINNICRVYSSTNMILDDNYSRIHYDIPDELDPLVFIQRYNNIFYSKMDYLKIMEQEQKDFIYISFNNLKNNSDFAGLDSKYFKLKYKIDVNLDFSSYLERYSNIKHEILNNSNDLNMKNIRIAKEELYLYKNYDKYQYSYVLDELYYKIYYKIPEIFDFDTYLKIYSNLIKELDLKSKDTLLEISDYVKDTLVANDKCKLYKFYSTMGVSYPLNDSYFELYYKDVYKIPDDFDIFMYSKVYDNDLVNELKNINKETNNDVYVKKLSICLKTYPLNEYYYKLKYNLPQDFDVNIYSKTYKLTENSLTDLYKNINLDKNPLNNTYYKLKYNLPEELDEDTYLKCYSELKFLLYDYVVGTLEYNIKLYSIIDLNLKPLNEKYYKLKDNIPDILDIDIYLKTYETTLLENIEHAEKIEELKKLEKHSMKYLKVAYSLVDLISRPINENYYKNKYEVPIELDIVAYEKRYPEMTNIVNKEDKSLEQFKLQLYETYNTLKEYFPLDENYFKIKYNIPVYVDFTTYFDKYDELKLELEKVDKNTFDYYTKACELIDLENKSLDIYFFKLKYKIPESLDLNIYLSRYNELNQYVQHLQKDSFEYVDKLCSLIDLINKPIDVEYYKIQYNLPELFDVYIYLQRYSVLEERVKHLEKNTINYEAYICSIVNFQENPLDDIYLKLYFDVPMRFNWEYYYLEHIEVLENSILDYKGNENTKKIKAYCYYNCGHTTIKNIKNKKDKIVNTNEIIEYCKKYSHLFLQTRIDIDYNFCLLFYKNEIIEKDLYELFKNNVNIDTIKINKNNECYENEKIYIENYEYICSNISRKMNTSMKDVLLIREFIEEYIKNNHSSYHIKFNEINHEKIINNIIFDNTNNIYKKAFELYKNKNYLINNIKNNTIRFLKDASTTNVVYIYYAYDEKSLTLCNFIHSLQYIPYNSNVYIVTNNNSFNLVDNKYYKNINIINYVTTSKLLKEIIKDMNCSHVFTWDVKYLMANEHLFTDLDNNILIGYVNLEKKTLNSGILRKLSYIQNNIKNETEDYLNLLTFRKHDKAYDLLIL